MDLVSSTGLMALAPQFIPGQGIPDQVFAQDKVIWAITGFYSTIVSEMKAIEKSTAEVCARQITSFGNLPLRVLTAGLYYPNPALCDAENQQFQEEWQAMKSELAAQASKGKQTIAE